MITPFICARPQRAQNGTFCFIGREACTGAFVAARGRQGPGARRRPHWHTGPGRGGGAGPNRSPNAVTRPHRNITCMDIMPCDRLHALRV